MPPTLPGEDDTTYTNRLLGRLGPDQMPYNHRRFRHCSIGQHEGCSDPGGETCECPCHQDMTPEEMRAFYDHPENRKIIGPASAYRPPARLRAPERRNRATARGTWWMVDA